MLLSVGLAALLPLIAVVLIATNSAYRIVERESFRYAEEQGMHYAALIGGELNSRVASLETMASMLRAYPLIPGPSRRQAIAHELRSMLELDSDVLAVWTLWEPGAIDDDAARADPAFRSPSGAFYATWHRDKGQIVQGHIGDQVWQGDYYRLPKLQMAPTLIDPYWYSYTNSDGDKVLETTISVPIVTDDAFKGVVGLDFSPEVYGNILSDLKIYRTGYAALIASNGKRIWHPLGSLIGTFTGDDLPPEKQEGILKKIAEGKAFSVDKRALVTGAWSRQFLIPVRTNTAGSPWFIAVIVPFSEVRRDADLLSSLLYAIGVISIVVVGLAIYLTARGLAAPIASLSAGAKRISSGDLSGRVRLYGCDEVAELAASFNAMTDELQKMLDKYEASNRDLAAKNLELSETQASLRSLNAELEKRVGERTALLSQTNRSLKERNEELQETFERLQEAQEKIIASEKLAILGKLAANVGHELNTPLAAIRSSIELIRSSAPAFYDALPDFMLSLGPNERTLFNLLLNRGRSNASDLSGSGDRARRWALSSRLAALGLSDPELLASEVESLGAFDLEGEITAAAKAGRRDIVSIAAQIVAFFRADEIIWTATDKAGLTVSALADYSRPAEIENPGPFEPIKEIETILLLYHNTMKSGVVVERRFECRDPAFGYGERLSHVWSNIIHNALQAMEYRGKLEIGTKREGDWIAVSFTDSGPGVPEEAKPFIFKPFFTTKKTGEGTGLGLDICREIVERSKGKISFESRPGRTTFTVLLKAAAL